MGSSRRNDWAARLGILVFLKESSNRLEGHLAYAIINSRFRRKTPYPQERKLGVLAGGFESSRSFPASQPPHPKSFPRPKTVSKSRPVRLMLAHLSFLRRLRQFPVPLPDASSAARRRLSFHQFSDWIAPFRRPSAVLSLRITHRPLAFLSLATLFHLEREVGSTGWRVRIE
jgi:hypothetical protein